jgi:hypothetical protein
VSIVKTANFWHCAWVGMTFVNKTALQQGYCILQLGCNYLFELLDILLWLKISNLLIQASHFWITSNSSTRSCSSCKLLHVCSKSSLSYHSYFSTVVRLCQNALQSSNLLEPVILHHLMQPQNDFLVAFSYSLFYSWSL